MTLRPLYRCKRCGATFEGFPFLPCPNPQGLDDMQQLWEQRPHQITHLCPGEYLGYAVLVGARKESD